MLQRLYQWTMSLADHPRALWVLAIVAFVESSVFPIPPDVLMIPMILARPSRAWLIALVATVSSVLGGMLVWWLWVMVARMCTVLVPCFALLDCSCRLHCEYCAGGIQL